MEFDGAQLPNPNAHAAPGTILGAEQKRWFLERLREAKAPWKLWGNSVDSLDWRTDLQRQLSNAPSPSCCDWLSG
ncbi:MAG: alkaline phosphatase D family protein [Gemmatimonadaceae bacterium]|nr:alkaline phosphatase D family protein [Gemmatimonadaceae bacterium]